MDIQINGKNYRVEDFASEETVKEDFALEKSVILSFLKVEGRVYPNSSIEIKNIENFFEQNASSITKEKVDELANEFQNLTKADIPIVWLLWKYKKQKIKNMKETFISKKYADIFKNISSSLTRTDEIIAFYNIFLERFRKETELLEQRQQDRKEMSAYLDTIKAVPFGDFSVEGSAREIILSLEHKEDLINIFDSIDLSEKIPFVFTFHRGKFVFKVFDIFRPNEKWIEKILKEEQITSYISNHPLDGYTKALWKLQDKNIHLKLSLTKQTEKMYDEFLNVIITSLEPRIKVNIFKNEITRIKGSYSVSDVNINPFILADMIMMDSVVSFFTFMSESTRSATDKKTLSMYYRVGRDFVKRGSPTLNITLRPKGEIIVKISKLSTQEIVPNIQNIFGKLFAIYKKEKKKITNIYLEIVSKNELTLKAKELGRKNIKSGDRLLMLQKARPKLFSGSYSSICQLVVHQPYLIPADEVEEYKRKAAITNKDLIKEGDSTDGSQFVLNFPPGGDDWYGCLEREDENFPFDKKPVPYPGITQNTRGPGTDILERPCFPCCQAINQEHTIASELKKCNLKTRGSQIKESSSVGHVLAPNKRATQGRHGHLPHYISLIATIAGYKKINENRKIFLPILRYGVVESPDSFLHCMIRATDEDYAATLNLKRKLKIVSEYRDRIIERLMSGIPPLAMQSTFNKTPNELVSILKDKTAYIDPRLFVGIMEIVFDVNIYLFGVTERHEYGKFILPNNAIAYLEPTQKYDKNIVICIFYKRKGVGLIHPSQSELLVKYDPKAKRHSKKFVFSFKNNEPLIEQCEKTLKIGNKVYFVDN